MVVVNLPTDSGEEPFFSCLLAEVKAFDVVHPFHKVQLPGYMNLLGILLSSVINFNARNLTQGLFRLIHRRS